MTGKTGSRVRISLSPQEERDSKHIKTRALNLALSIGKVEGDSMVNAGICDGDIAVIDRAVEPLLGDVVVGYIDKELTKKPQVTLDTQLMNVSCTWMA